MKDFGHKKTLDSSKGSFFVFRSLDQLQAIVNVFFCEYKLSNLIFFHSIFLVS